MGFVARCIASHRIAIDRARQKWKLMSQESEIDRSSKLVLMTQDDDRDSHGYISITLLSDTLEKP